MFDYHKSIDAESIFNEFARHRKSSIEYAGDALNIEFIDRFEASSKPSKIKHYFKNIMASVFVSSALCFYNPALASDNDTIKIRTGEHKGFTRLVIEALNPENIMLEHVQFLKIPL